MKKAILSLALVLCLLAVPFCTASAAATPVDLMATSDDGYTIVAGDGTVEIADGKMVFTNNGDGDFRVTIDTKTVFDLEALHTLHMDFNAEMPFKMAYYLVSEDGTSAWLNTSTNFAGSYEVDTAADRAAKGEYDITMKLTDEITNIADMSQVHFDQFIVLMTGKGTFTLNTVEMTDGTASSDKDDTDKDETEATTTKAPTTTTKKEASKDDAEESAKTGDTSSAVLFATVAVAAVGVVTLCTVSKKSKAN